MRESLRTLVTVSFFTFCFAGACFTSSYACDKGKKPSAALEMVDQLIEREKLQEALYKLEEIGLEKSKDKGEVNVRLGRIYLQLSKPAKALQFFEAANFLTMDCGEVYLGLAQSTLGLGRLARARKYAKMALKTDPDLIDAHVVIAKLENRTGQIETARQRYRNLLNNQPKNEDLTVAYAEFLADRAEYKTAIKLLNDFVLRSPFAAGAIDKLGQLSWLNGERDNAIQHRKTAAKLFASQGNLYRANLILAWVNQVISSASEPRKRPPRPEPKSKTEEANKQPKREEKERSQSPSFPTLVRPEPIKIPKGSSVGQGSGFVINGGTQVITNFHVIDGAINIITRSGAGEVRNAKVIATSETDDLAVLSLENSYPEHYAISYGRMEDPKPGRSAVVLGYPMGSVLGVSTPSLTEGIVSKVYQSGKNVSIFHITAKLNKGNSGGPVFDRRGNLIGVAVAKLDTTAYFKEKGYLPEDINFAVKISRMLKLVQRDIPDGNQLASMDKDLEELYEMALPSVVLIISVLAADEGKTLPSR